jgi:dethiobiotin synthetase
MDSNFKMLLILNRSKVPFITGDQPVINTFNRSKYSKELVEKLEFYYPVSPNIAILITDRQEYIDIDSLYLDESDMIHKYNSLIIEASHEQIYSNSEEILKDYFEFM